MGLAYCESCDHNHLFVIHFSYLVVLVRNYINLDSSIFGEFVFLPWNAT
jgi:hypothetical protein